MNGAFNVNRRLCESAVIGNGRLDAGMQAITKPFGMIILADKLRDIIES